MQNKLLIQKLYTQLYIPLCEIQPLQSSGVTDVKVASSSVSMSSTLSISVDVDFNTVLTLENISSMGLKSGEYGGRKCTSAPTSSIAFMIPDA